MAKSYVRPARTTATDSERLDGGTDFEFMDMDVEQRPRRRTGINSKVVKITTVLVVLVIATIVVLAVLYGKEDIVQNDATPLHDPSKLEDNANKELGRTTKQIDKTEEAISTPATKTPGPPPNSPSSKEILVATTFTERLSTEDKKTTTIKGDTTFTHESRTAFTTIAATSPTSTTAETSSTITNAETSSTLPKAGTSSTLPNAETSATLTTAETSSTLTTAETSSTLTTAETSSTLTTAETSSTLTTAETSSTLSTAETGNSTKITIHEEGTSTITVTEIEPGIVKERNVTAEANGTTVSVISMDSSNASEETHVSTVEYTYEVTTISTTSMPQYPSPITEVETGQWYVIMSSKDGSVLDVFSGSKQSGAQIGMWAYLHNSNQEFRFNEVSSVQNNTYVIENRRSGKQVIYRPIHGYYSRHSSSLQLWDVNLSTNEVWNVTAIEGQPGRFRMANLQTKLCVDRKNVDNDHDSVDMVDCASTKDDQWYFIPVCD